MKRFLSILILTALFTTTLHSQGGMWLPYLLSDKTVANMQAAGCKLTPEQIFDLKKTSLKDAVLQFNNGCTAEIISPNGLVLTNHHCGIGQIQSHSSVDHDYLQDGFWAKNYGEELVNENIAVYFLKDVVDVTDKILAGVKDTMSYQSRMEVIKANNAALRDEKKQQGAKNIEIVPFYHGNQYILFEYEAYEDVRLVACPPWGIGKYGADTDNWTWPRHKGDFCMFRIYTAPDGSPAKYAKENIPLKSKKYFPISMKGVKEGDYAMILGYPGSTDRYSSSQDVLLTMNYTDPAIVDIRTVKLDTYRKYMDADPQVFIKYASKQASVSNYWKYSIGQMKQLKRNKVVEKKVEQEKKFAKWIREDAKRQAMYKNVLADFQKKFDILKTYQTPYMYYREAGINCCEAVNFAGRFNALNKMIKAKKDKEEIAKKADEMKHYVESYFDDYDFELDKNVAINVINLFNERIPENMRPELINKIGEKYDGDFTEYVTKCFEKSVFTSKDKVLAWLENPKSVDKDPIMVLRNAFYDKFVADIYPKVLEAHQQSYDASRLYMKALMEMDENGNFYPDANFTMRLTYGNVKSYDPADAVHYDYKTTLDGVMAKYVPGNWEFDLPEQLIDLYNKKDYGVYADENGDMVVNFITTNDITGGNSGSPVLDAHGNMIGIAFDGNWEAMSGDISFENEVQRTICVDIRYFLFVVDKIGHAQNLLDEMTIIR